MGENPRMSSGFCYTFGTFFHTILSTSTQLTKTDQTIWLLSLVSLKLSSFILHHFLCKQLTATPCMSFHKHVFTMTEQNCLSIYTIHYISPYSMTAGFMPHFPMWPYKLGIKKFAFKCGWKYDIAHYMVTPFFCSSPIHSQLGSHRPCDQWVTARANMNEYSEKFRPPY